MSDSEASDVSEPSSPVASNSTSKTGSSSFSFFNIKSCTGGAIEETAMDRLRRREILIKQKEMLNNDINTSQAATESNSKSNTTSSLRRNMYVAENHTEFKRQQNASGSIGTLNRFEYNLELPQKRQFPIKFSPEVYEVDVIGEIVDDSPQGKLDAIKKIIELNDDKSAVQHAFDLYNEVLGNESNSKNSLSKTFRAPFPLPLSIRLPRRTYDLKFTFELPRTTLFELSKNYRESGQTDSIRPFTIPLNFNANALHGQLNSLGINAVDQDDFHLEVFQIDCVSEQSNIPVLCDKILQSKPNETGTNVHWSTPSGMIADPKYEDEPFRWSYNLIQPNSCGVPLNRTMFVGDPKVLGHADWSRWRHVNHDTLDELLGNNLLINNGVHVQFQNGTGSDAKVGRDTESYYDWNQSMIAAKPLKRNRLQPREVVYPSEDETEDFDGVLVPSKNATCFRHVISDGVFRDQGDFLGFLIQDRFDEVCLMMNEMQRKNAELPDSQRKLDSRPFGIAGPEWVKPVVDVCNRKGPKVSYIPIKIVSKLIKAQQKRMNPAEHLLNLQHLQLHVYPMGGHEAWKQLGSIALEEHQTECLKCPKNQVVYNCTINIKCQRC